MELRRSVCGIVFPLLLLCGSTLCFAQSGDDGGMLYFPPKLVLDFKKLDYYSSYYNRSEEEDTEKARAIELSKGTDYYVGLLLPVVFYKAGDAQFPDRYNILFNSLETDKYGDSALFEGWDDVGMYHDVLNIIGYRMKHIPEAKISLEGGYSTAPGEDQQVAQDRAEVVREYLMNIWKIEPERIAILPPQRMCDSGANIMLQEEAQRVAIYPDTYQLIEPVHYRSTGFYSTSIEFNIVVQPNTEKPEDVAAVEIVLRTEDKVLSRTQVQGSSDSAFYRMQGTWEADAAVLDKAGILEVYAIVYQWDGSKRESNMITIPIKVDESTSDAYNPYESWDGYSFEIVLPFFSAGADTLNEIQKMLLDGIQDNMVLDTPEYTDSDDPENQPDPNQHFEVWVNADAEVAEAAGADNATLSARAAEYWNLDGKILNMYDEMPQEGPMRLYGSDMAPTGDYYIRTYGDRGEDLRTAYDNQSSLTDIELKDNEVYPLLIRREKGVGIYMKKSERGAHYDSLYASTEPDSATAAEDAQEPYDVSLNCYFTPEERLYNRRVTISGYSGDEGYRDRGLE